jgi:PIN domain nuclease of toxin-antitoxin system
VSPTAVDALQSAEELAVAAITWFELAWLATHDRIQVVLPIRTWLDRLAADVRTLPLTAAVAETAVGLPSSFPGDPADRMIYATAIEHGCRLITKDERLRKHVYPRQIALW